MAKRVKGKRVKEMRDMAGDKPNLGGATWQFDRDEADAAYEAAFKAATSLGESEVAVVSRRRSLAKQVYNFIVTVMPVAELGPLKRTVENMDDPEVKLPKPVEAYLREHGLPLPHFNARNPFLPIFNRFYQAAHGNMSIEDKTSLELTAAGLKEANRLASANDEVSDKAYRRDYQNIYRYAMMVCAAIDRDDPKLLDGNPKVVVNEYVAWRRKHPTLALPAASTRTPNDITSRKDAAGGYSAVAARGVESVIRGHEPDGEAGGDTSEEVASGTDTSGSEEPTDEQSGEVLEHVDEDPDEEPVTIDQVVRDFRVLDKPSTFAPAWLKSYINDAAEEGVLTLRYRKVDGRLVVDGFNFLMNP
jgi:hypothetical protein